MEDIGHFQLMYSKELSSLRTCFDFSEFARARIKERISPKACSLEKTAAIAKFSAESLRWLLEDAHEHYEIICRRDQGEPISPFRFSNWSIYQHYWVYQVSKAIVLLDQFPLDSKGFDSLAPDREHNPDFKQYWPKTPGATAFYGVGFSAAEAIRNALAIFMEKSHLRRFPDLPNDIAFPNGYDLSDRDKIITEFNKTGDVLPLVLDFQNLSCYWAVEYMSPDKWTSGEIEKEYSKVICLIDHEIEQVLSRSRNESNSKDGRQDEQAAITTPEDLVPPGIEGSDEDCRHSTDFLSVTWYGKSYTFNKTQAQCIKVLWEEWEKGCPLISEKTIGDKIGSSCDNYRLINTFRSKGKKHIAWDKMIQGGQGKYKLDKPPKKKSKKNK